MRRASRTRSSRPRPDATNIYAVAENPDRKTLSAPAPSPDHPYPPRLCDASVWRDEREAERDGRAGDQTIERVPERGQCSRLGHVSAAADMKALFVEGGNLPYRTVPNPAAPPLEPSFP